MMFRTEIAVKPLPNVITYETPILMFGSCFTDHIGAKLQTAKLPVTANPFGVLYNPESIAHHIDRLLTAQAFAVDELYQYRDLWVSFAHHGSFSDQNKAVCWQKISDTYQNISNKLSKTHFLVITFGTSFIYKRKDTGHTVANCHQLPDHFFEQKILTIQEITDQWQLLLQRLFAQIPHLHVIFTLSPIRHWKDGASNNQWSKAILTVAIHELLRLFPQQTSYFPAYELLMDDLRDYRFYEQDMLHVNATAIDYVWDKFKSQYLHRTDVSLMMAQIARINAAYQHRPRHPNTSAHHQFLRQMSAEIDAIAQKYPSIDFEKERGYFNPLG